MFFTHRLLEAFLLPPVGPLLLIVLGMLLQPFLRRTGRALAWLGVVVSFAFILPSSVEWIAAPLESDSPPLDIKQIDGAGAIVILGGGRQPYAPEYGYSTVNRLTLERLRYGAHLARATRLPVLLSGGVARNGYSEAEMMSRVLAKDFSVIPYWIEADSSSTAENARFSANLLKQEGIRRVVLVTHAMHMRRARIYFEAAGLNVTPAPMGFQALPPKPENSLTYLPTSSSAYAGWYAAHEWAGLLQQRFIK